MHFTFGATPYDWEAEWRNQIGESPNEQGEYVDIGVQDDGYYLDKGKLSRLPIIEEPLKFPYPKNPKICLIIPIYDNLRTPHCPEKFFFKSALWVVRSFLKNSDITDADVAIKFFVEDTLRDRFRPYLSACGLSENDCIFFEDYKFKELRKRQSYCCRTYMWYHSKLLEYSHLLLLDSDIFLRRLEKNQRVPIFGKMTAIAHLTPEAIWGRGGFYTQKVLKPTSVRVEWGPNIRSMHDYLELVAEATDKSLETVYAEWTGKTLDGSDVAFLSNFIDMSGKMILFPIQWFNQKYPDYENWADKWVESLYIDERMNSIYIYKHSIPIHNFESIYPIAMSVESLWKKFPPLIDICFA